MPSLLSEAAAMGTSALWVAAVAVPVGAVCWWLARRWREPVVPRYRKGFSRWDGFDALVLFAACVLFPPALASVVDLTGIFQPILGGGSPVQPDRANDFDYLSRRRTVTGLALMPLVTAAFVLWKRHAGKEPIRPPCEKSHRFFADIAAGIAAWLVLMPVTLAVHFVVNAVCAELDIAPEEHPLKKTQLATAFDVLLFFAGTCLVAPFFEEMAFRRVLLPWVARRSYRAWILMGFALLFASSRAEGHSRVGPFALVGLVAVALFAFVSVATRWRRFPLRPASAVLATATFFAAMHSSVWPTPIPLLVLGVGLGWLVLRTKSVTAAVVAHGLFNAVSAVFLVRS